MNAYIFDDNTKEREFHRLQLIEAANDPTTIASLQRTGIQPGWSCLELGAGAGSILRWLGNQVGPNGTVWGVDKHTTYLSEFSGPPYDIRQGDFLNVLITYVIVFVLMLFAGIRNKNSNQPVLIGQIHQRR